MVRPQLHSSVRRRYGFDVVILKAVVVCVIAGGLLIILLGQYRRRRSSAVAHFAVAAGCFVVVVAIAHVLEATGAFARERAGVSRRALVITSIWAHGALATGPHDPARLMASNPHNAGRRGATSDRCGPRLVASVVVCFSSVPVSSTQRWVRSLREDFPENAPRVGI